jgi:hypothetical protein
MSDEFSIATVTLLITGIAVGEISPSVALLFDLVKLGFGNLTRI